MRTDLLTGKLAFLDREWAAPLHADIVLPRLLAESGIRTTLITDNYVLLMRQNDISIFFDQCSFIRGSGSDEYETISNRPRTEFAPGRTPEFEDQCVANVVGWQSRGGPPFARLFQQAARTLRTELESGSKFLIWVDSFTPHEPWIDPEDLTQPFCSVPLLPMNGASSCYSESQLRDLRRRYARRILALDRSLSPFVEVLTSIASGEVLLMLASDHGFLFGEYGLVGKPKEWPPVPELYEIPIWVSPSLYHRLPTEYCIQPHMLTSALVECLDSNIGEKVFRGANTSRWNIVGRNGPLVRHVALVNSDEQIVLHRDKWHESNAWYSRTALNPALNWENQPCTVTSGQGHIVNRGDIPDNSPWLLNFSKSLTELVKL